MTSDRFVPWVIVSLTLAQATASLAQDQTAKPNVQSPPREATAAPAAPVRPVTDNYYGTAVADPYRYMENMKAPEVLAWFKAQHDYTAARLAAIPDRAALLSRIRELDRTVPQVHATPLPDDTYLILKRLPVEDVLKLYIRHGLTGSDRLLVDPERVAIAPSLRGKGRNVILYQAVSPDRRYLAVGIAPGGAELDTELHIMEVATGRELPDVMPRAWADTVGWLSDSRSLIYLKLRKLAPDAPVTEKEQEVRTYLHVLGTDPERDPAVFGYQAVPGIDVDRAWFGIVAATPGSEYALGQLNSGVSPNSIYYVQRAADIGTPRSKWLRLADTSDDVAGIVPHGEDLYVLTYKNALRYKVLRVDARQPDLASAETVVPAGASVVESISAAEDALYVGLRDGVVSRLLRVPYGPHPHAEEVPLPVQGSASPIADPRVPGVLLNTRTWTQGFTIYRYDPITHRVTDTGLQPLGPYDRPANLAAIEVKVPSYDGTLIPLSIVSPRGLELDGTNPTLLEGYGAYGYPDPPEYNPIRLAWHEHGGIYADCHVRGGGAYGEEWHLAGKESTKPNTWRDFIACAQYLVDHHYTSPGRIAGWGTSAGGILIGRSITERPDLFGAAIDAVGASDMLRFETSANGVPNIPEFGSTRTEDGFRSLLAMSAYHHVHEGIAYPAVLLETGFNDPRVDSWQMGKMAARLEAATTSGKPVLLRVDYAGGHGGIGGTEQQRQETRADEYSFLLWVFGVPEFQPTI